MPSKRNLAIRRAAVREEKAAAREEQREAKSDWYFDFSKLRKKIHEFLYAFVLSGIFWCPQHRWINAMCEVHILPFMLESVVVPISMFRKLPWPIGLWFEAYPEDMGDTMEGTLVKSCKECLHFEMIWGGTSFGLKLAVSCIRFAWFSWRASAWDGTYIIKPELLILILDVVMHFIRVCELWHNSSPFYLAKLLPPQSTPMHLTIDETSPALSIGCEGTAALTDSCSKESDESPSPTSSTSSSSISDYIDERPKDDVDEPPECTCCMDQPATWRMSDCGHAIACEDCSCLFVQRALRHLRRDCLEPLTLEELRNTRFPCPICRTSGTIEGEKGFLQTAEPSKHRSETTYEKRSCACCMGRVASWRMSSCEHQVACSACRPQLVYHVLRKNRVAGVTSKRGLTNELLRTTSIPCPLCREVSLLVSIQPSKAVGSSTLE